MNMVKFILAGLAAATLTSANAAQVEAFANATVQPGGVRTGTSGLAFFNVEGSDLGSFASYGAIRFDVASIKSQFDAQFGIGGWAVSDISLQLTQSNAAFTADGGVAVYFSSNDSVSLSAPSPLTYGSFSSSFASASLVTDYTFSQVSTGHVETHQLFDRLGANTSGASLLAADVLADSRVTLLLRDASTDVAATYAGYTNFTNAGPTLVINAVAVVPEADTYAMLLAGLGLLGMVARRRKA